MTPKILEYLETVETATYEDISKAVGLEAKKLSPMVRSLVDLDLVKIVGNTGGAKGNSKIFKLTKTK